MILLNDVVEVATAPHPYAFPLHAGSCPCLLADPQAVKDVFAVKLGFAPRAGIKFPELGLDQATITGGRMSAMSVLTQEATLTLHQSFRIASERYRSLRHCLPPIRTAL
jgi:hypothetical protein